MSIASGEQLTAPSVSETTGLLGSLVQIEYVSPTSKRVITYEGWLSGLPSDTAKDTTVTSKYGDERIIPHEAVYIVQQVTRISHDEQTPQAGHPTTLIFSGGDSAFSIIPIQPTLPEQR